MARAGFGIGKEKSELLLVVPSFPLTLELIFDDLSHTDNRCCLLMWNWMMYGSFDSMEQE
jgi:hypothetical protein